MEENENNKKIVLTVVSLLVLVVVVIGVSYAAFNYAKTGSKENVIKTGTITMTYTEGENKISINNAVPMEDSVGKLLSDIDQVFDFTISINIIGNTTISYEVTAEKDDASTLGNNDVRIYLEKSTDATNYSAVKNPSGYIPLGEVDEFKAGANEMRLDVGSTTSTVTYYYKLRMWVSKDYETTNESKFFTIRINAYGSDSAVVEEKPTPTESTGATNIIEKANDPGITNYTDGDPTQPYVFNHPATEQTPALTDYRYIGANPANYVSFNDELWRIIGIFDVDDGTGNYEKRIKLIRNTGIGDLPWDSNFVNDWATSSLKILLNSGDYYSRSGSYVTIGLNEEAKSMITDAKWYLGSSGEFQNLGGPDYYNFERGTTVYSGRPTSWIGKVGIIYASDYVYTYSNGVDNTCYTYGNRCENGAPQNGWIYNRNFNNNDTTVTTGTPALTWTITPSSDSSNCALLLAEIGSVYYYGGVIGNHFYVIRPSVYLRSDINIAEGEGTISNPYKLSL